MIGTVAAVWTVFFVFAPGGAPQYTIWLALPLLLANARLGLFYVVAAFPLMFVYYPVAFAGILPWSPYPTAYALWHGIREHLSWTGPGLLLWAAQVWILAREARTWFAAPQVEDDLSLRSAALSGSSAPQAAH